MKFAEIVACVLAAVALVFTAAYAAGDAAKGKVLFNDPKFAGGSKACAECHPNGKGLEKAGTKKEFHVMDQTQKSLEEAVNVCIVAANKGRAIDVKSPQMQDIVAYIRSLSGKKSSSSY